MDSEKEGQKTKYKVIIVSTTPGDIDFIKDSLGSSALSSFDVLCIEGISGVIEDIKKGVFDAVLLNFHSDTDSDETIFKIKHICSAVPLILIADIDTEDKLMHYMEMGVYDCIVKSEVSRSQLARYVLFAIERFKRMKSINERMNELESVEDTLRGIIEENTEPVIIVDADGIIRFVNRSAESLFGRDKEGLVGEMFKFSVNPDKITEIEVDRPDGKKMLLEMRTIAIAWQKDIAYLIWLHNITGIVSIREEMRAMYLIDELTGLFNQRGILVLGEQQLKIANRNKKGMFFIRVDVTHLMDINNNFGPYTGDELLVDLASILRDTFRKSDIISRIGNGQFIIIAIEADRENGNTICLRLEDNIRDFNSRSGRKYKISIDIKKIYYDPNIPSSFDEILSKF